jgi:hypothetical protein
MKIFGKRRFIAFLRAHYPDGTAGRQGALGIQKLTDDQEIIEEMG